MFTGGGKPYGKLNNEEIFGQTKGDPPLQSPLTYYYKNNGERTTAEIPLGIQVLMQDCFVADKKRITASKAKSRLESQR
jgi:hypothetical protein